MFVYFSGNFEVGVNHVDQIQITLENIELLKSQFQISVTFSLLNG